MRKKLFISTTLSILLVTSQLHSEGIHINGYDLSYNADLDALIKGESFLIKNLNQLPNIQKPYTYMTSDELLIQLENLERQSNKKQQEINRLVAENRKQQKIIDNNQDASKQYFKNLEDKDKEIKGLKFQIETLIAKLQVNSIQTATVAEASSETSAPLIATAETANTTNGFTTPPPPPPLPEGAALLANTNVAVPPAGMSVVGAPPPPPLPAFPGSTVKIDAINFEDKLNECKGHLEDYFGKLNNSLSFKGLCYSKIAYLLKQDNYYNETLNSLKAIATRQINLLEQVDLFDSFSQNTNIDEEKADIEAIQKIKQSLCEFFNAIKDIKQETKAKKDAIIKNIVDIKLPEQSFKEDFKHLCKIVFRYKDKYMNTFEKHNIGLLQIIVHNAAIFENTLKCTQNIFQHIENFKTNLTGNNIQLANDLNIMEVLTDVQGKKIPPTMNFLNTQLESTERIQLGDAAKVIHDYVNNNIMHVSDDWNDDRKNKAIDMLRIIIEAIEKSEQKESLTKHFSNKFEQLSRQDLFLSKKNHLIDIKKLIEQAKSSNAEETCFIVGSTASKQILNKFVSNGICFSSQKPLLETDELDNCLKATNIEINLNEIKQSFSNIFIPLKRFLTAQSKSKDIIEKVIDYYADIYIDNATYFRSNFIRNFELSIDFKPETIQKYLPIVKYKQANFSEAGTGSAVPQVVNYIDKKCYKSSYEMLENTIQRMLEKIKDKQQRINNLQEISESLIPAQFRAKILLNPLSENLSKILSEANPDEDSSENTVILITQNVEGAIAHDGPLYQGDLFYPTSSKFISSNNKNPHAFYIAKLMLYTKKLFSYLYDSAGTSTILLKGESINTVSNLTTSIANLKSQLEKINIDDSIKSFADNNIEESVTSQVIINCFTKYKDAIKQLQTDANLLSKSKRSKLQTVPNFDGIDKRVDQPQTDYENIKTSPFITKFKNTDIDTKISSCQQLFDKLEEISNQINNITSDIVARKVPELSKQITQIQRIHYELSDLLTNSEISKILKSLQQLKSWQKIAYVSQYVFEKYTSLESTPGLEDVIDSILRIPEEERTNIDRSIAAIVSNVKILKEISGPLQKSSNKAAPDIDQLDPSRSQRPSLTP